MPTEKELKADARAFLNSVFGTPVPADVAGRIKFLKENNWVPEDNRMKVELAACVYAMTILDGANDSLIGQLVDGLIDKPKRRDCARVFLEVFYRVTEDVTPKQKQNKFSKYIAAIRYLTAEQILPSKVQMLAKGRGEGLDQWSRRASKTKLTVQKPSAATVGTMVKFKMTVGSEKRTWLIGDAGRANRVAASLDKLQAAGKRKLPTR